MGILDPELTTLAFCWRLERRDGVAIGFTSHDRDLAIGGLVYRAAPGMLPSAIELTDGLEAETLNVAGALSSAAITEGDLADGRWDGAAVRLFMVDWEAPEEESVYLTRGTLGEIAISGTRFETQVRGPAATLDRPAAEETSPECRAELGDRRCRVDLAGRVAIVWVGGVVDEETLEMSAAEPEANCYAYGRARWIGGANGGLDVPILSSDGNRIVLRDPPARSVAPGDLVELRQGCDRRFATCAGRFGNAANFRGEPHLPGMDLLTRFPGAS